VPSYLVKVSGLERMLLERSEAECEWEDADMEDEGM
jgi:hypothetical protein